VPELEPELELEAMLDSMPELLLLGCKLFALQPVSKMITHIIEKILHISLLVFIAIPAFIYISIGSCNSDGLMKDVIIFIMQILLL
jgi:hypothetical protein